MSMDEGSSSYSESSSYSDSESDMDITGNENGFMFKVERLDARNEIGHGAEKAKSFLKDHFWGDRIVFGDLFILGIPRVNTDRYQPKQRARAPAKPFLVG